MKIIWALLVLLLLAGWSIARYGAPIEPSRPTCDAIAWRRTQTGWENAANWQTDQVARPKPLHPGVVASFCLLASLLALASFSAPPDNPELPTPSQNAGPAESAKS